MKFLDSELFSSLDRAFARWIAGQVKTDNELLALVAALLSRQLSEGHTCLDLAEAMQDPALSGYFPVNTMSLLEKHPFISHDDSMQQPFIIKDNNIFLYRYWKYEERLSKALRSLAVSTKGCVTEESRLQSALDIHFPDKEDLQRKAVHTALTKSLCIITGGPGTGKTWTLARMLAVLRTLDPSGTFRVALAAPTGKAAHRMEEALRETLPGSDHATYTLHRLLRPVRDTPYFRYNAENPLPFDMVVVDEASMADLALLSKLTDALPEDGRLVLIGDKDQLASVEPGSVLGDICLACASSDLLQGCLVELTRQHRFKGNSQIETLAAAVKSGNAAEAVAILNSSGNLISPPEGNRFQSMLKLKMEPVLKTLSRARTPEELLEEIDRFRILCVTNTGRAGKDSLNLGLSALARKQAGRPDAAGPYHGMPVMCLENDYTLGLFNGDTGVIGASGQGLRAFFRTEGANLRNILPGRLPLHDTCYAMTIHKAQGSEFEKVLLILPDKMTPLLTREIFYTAITRAKEHIEVWGRPEILEMTVLQQRKRYSGLIQKLTKF
ncbi:MAG: exodeoxyribonuclease V subunit alpha [Fibrobacterota bacterium]